MSRAGVFPKSILKQPSHNSKADNDREVALAHASLIQQRKDTETEILEAIEALVDLPSLGQEDPTHSSTSDYLSVKKALNIFQPSDFDALIEERNINRRCGYVLCPNRNRLQDTKATFRLLHSGSRGSQSLKVVPTKDLEKWCSDECSRRALWLRIQLAEEPAWERRDKWSRSFTMLNGQPRHDEGGTVAALSAKMQDLGIDPQIPPLTQTMDELALERGDRCSSIRPTRGVDLNVVENPIRHRQVEAPTEGSYDTIEGHKVRKEHDILRRSFEDYTDDMLDVI